MFLYILVLILVAYTCSGDIVVLCYVMRCYVIPGAGMSSACTPGRLEQQNPLSPRPVHSTAQHGNENERKGKAHPPSTPASRTGSMRSQLPRVVFQLHVGKKEKKHPVTCVCVCVCARHVVWRCGPDVAGAPRCGRRTLLDGMGIDEAQAVGWWDKGEACFL